MKPVRVYTYLALIFAVVFGLRIYFALTTPTFDEYAYFVLRNVQHIREHVLPLFNDSLSYGGRLEIFPPLYYYILSLFSFFMPIFLMAKIIPNLFATTTIILAFLIAKELTNDNRSALFTALITGFIPIFFVKTLNSISAYSFVIPVILYCLYCLIRINESSHFVVQFIIGIAILRLTHASVILLVVALFVYLLLVKIERLPESRVDLEIILFSTIVVLWSLFISYKKAFIIHGPDVIWQNIPSFVLSRYFADVSLLQAIYQIGAIPFIFGIYIIYKYLFRENNRKLYILISFCLTVFFLLWLKLIEVNVGFMFLGIMLSLLASKYYSLFFSYLEKTRFSVYKTNIILGILVLVGVFSIFPSLYYSVRETQSAVPLEEVIAMEWIRESTPINSTVLATPDEGHLITAIAERKDVADSNYLLITDVEQRFEDIRTIYSTVSETNAARLLKKYEVDYIVLASSAQKNYNVTKLSYADSDCFEMVYSKGVKVYKVLCELDEQ